MTETTNVEKPSGVSVRAFSHGEESIILDILSDAFGSFADVPRTKAALSSRRFDADGCFIAEENGAPIGWVAATRLPQDKWFVIRYLAIRRARFQNTVAERLLTRAITYVESKGPEFLRATTPAVQPYVEVYRKLGFKPLRRDFRISWKIDDVPDAEDPQLEIEEVSDETMDGASSLFVRALSPYWDWRTEEEGGIVAVAGSFKEDRSRGARWIIARSDKEPVGLVGIIPDYYEQGVAWFRGAFVLPEHRGKGIGSALMSEISKFAKSTGQRKMIVYTFSYLDSLAPGAVLYLKSGGKIEAEYLQLARTWGSSVSGK
jgi:GNAT superfamily N-acetyltransferase